MKSHKVFIPGMFVIQYSPHCGGYFAQSWTGMLVTAISRLLAVSILFFSVNAFAGQDSYENGSFVRKDGAVVTISKNEGMSILRPRYYFKFTLADGTSISTVDIPFLLASAQVGGHDFTLVINHGSMVEVYGYGNSPMARQVLRFDGYTVVDVTTPGKQWLSIFLQLREHLIGYSVAVAILLMWFAFWINLYKAIPSQGFLWGVVGRTLWELSGLAITGIYLLLVSEFSPVLILIGAIFSVVLYQQIRKLIRRRKMASL